tara:strand:+ start:357 stop:500 length:144 start_codon:yes stop_codon:yes gene_type:complete
LPTGWTGFFKEIRVFNAAGKISYLVRYEVFLAVHFVKLGFTSRKILI